MGEDDSPGPSQLKAARGDPPAEKPEADEAVAAVLAGTDAIELADDLVEDKPGDAEPAAVKREAAPTRIRRMPVAERLKLALRGNLEARNVLARDPVKLVQAGVLRNPRVTLEEILNIAKSRSVSGDLLREVASEKEWVRQYGIRQALVQNPKTPLTVSLALLKGLRERDLRQLARSRNVPGVVQQAARRLLQQRER